MLVVGPDHRLKAGAALRHPWLLEGDHERAPSELRDSSAIERAPSELRDSSAVERAPSELPDSSAIERAPSELPDSSAIERAPSELPQLKRRGLTRQARARDVLKAVDGAMKGIMSS